jgi:catechol 2,3-dioxygenase-like lactoylglutathione lyase family enzyme
MSAHLRIARPVTDLSRSVTMYARGLDLEVVARFTHHDGFDGAILGSPDSNFHLEFTVCLKHPVSPAPTQEDLLVFYVTEPDAWSRNCSAMLAAGFKEVASFNPYWARHGRTYQDQDGYRVVVQQGAWSNQRAS